MTRAKGRARVALVAAIMLALAGCGKG